MNALGELFIGLGFNVDDKDLDKFDKTVGETINNIGKLAVAAVAVVAAMDKIVESATRGTIALENFNAQTGLSIDKLQSLQITSQLSNIGLSAEDVTQSVQSLQSQLAQIRLGQGNIAPFQLMGVDVLGQDAFGVLDQIREKIKGLDDMTATNLISQMGINPQMITVLRMSGQEWAGLNKQIMLTRGERESIMKIGIEVKKLQLIFQSFINKTIAGLEPFLVRAVKFMENLVFAIQKLNLQVPVVLLGMAGVLKMFKLLNKETLEWTMALTWLMLLLDDFAVWSRGGKSLFDYSGIQKFFNTITPEVEKLSKAAGGLTGLFDLMNIGGGAMLGARIGSVAGPYGVAGGAVIGGLAGIGADAYLHSQGNKTINQTNNFNVHSNAANPDDVAGAVQSQMDYANQGLNNGGF